MGLCGNFSVAVFTLSTSVPSFLTSTILYLLVCFKNVRFFSCNFFNTISLIKGKLNTVFKNDKECCEPYADFLSELITF